jgi:ribose transport system ATP-binding protein
LAEDCLSSSASITNASAVKLEAISKRFGATTALKGVSLALRAGEALALLGENGAGKSTLIKILAGVYGADSGEIHVDGVQRTFSSVSDAQNAGVTVIPQELRVARRLSVAENICLGSIPERRLFGVLPTIDRALMRQVATRALKRLDHALDPDQQVGRLSFAEQQIVVIARALTNNAKILILDEPTAALGEHDVERLLQVLTGLKREGVAIVYITHRLAEVRRIADRCVVLRDGQITGEFSSPNFSEIALTQAMTGQAAGQVLTRKKEPCEGYALTTDFGGTDLTLEPGEIVGVSGLIGSGVTHMVRALFGIGGSAQKFGCGEEGFSAPSPRAAIAAKFGFVAGERSLIAFPNLTVRENIILPYLAEYSTPLRLNRGKIDPLVARLLQSLDVRPARPTARMSDLSGGNQQKVLFARCLVETLELMILDDPTAGIDVGAKARIHNLVLKFANDGGRVVLSSTDMPELLAMCDRIFAVQSGRTVAEFRRGSNFDEKDIRTATGSV